jgi:hypothetical protein
MTTPTASSYPAAVAGWSGHLREGGTTSWLDWRSHARSDPLPAAPVRDHPLPDAVHLELVRRINQRSGRAERGLADLVLGTASPGRGRVDVPLPWAAEDRPRFGHPPIDPDALPTEELVRLAVGVLARLLPALPSPATPPDLTRWPVPWRRRFRLHGSPATVAAVRRALLGQGLVETDWRPVHLVLGRPLEVMMAEHWQAATVAGGHLRWATVWRRAEAIDALPARVDVVRTAERLAATASRTEPVHLVVAPEGAELSRIVAEVLSARPFELPDAGDAAHVDVLRRLNRLTALTHGPGQVRRLATTLADLLEEGATGTTVAATPRSALPWARRTSAARIARLGHRSGGSGVAGYAVHGDPGALAPTEPPSGPHSGPGRPGTIDPRRTLEVAVDGCLHAWRRQETPS